MKKSLKNKTMKKLTTYFLLFFTFFSYVETSGKNDSLKKHKNFIVGFGGSINNTLLYYPLYRDQLDRNSVSFNDQKISSAGEGELFVGFQTKKRRITLGLGYADYQSKNLHIDNYPNSSNTSTTVEYTFYHKFYKSNINLNWLLGDNGRWMIGANLDCGILFYFKEFRHVEHTLGQSNIDLIYEYPSPQVIIFTGINFGRLFKINERIDLGIVFNTKVSSRIIGADNSESQITKSKTPDRNLLIKSLNLNLNFKM